MSRRLLVTTILDVYVLRRFLFLYGGNVLCFTLVYVLIDAFENLGDFERETETLGELLRFCGRYYSAVLPVVFCHLLGPVVALTSGLFTVTLFHRANELVPMLANGRPFWRIFLPVFLAGALISVGTFVVQELWIPEHAEVYREMAGKKRGRTILENRKYLDTGEKILIVLKKYHVLDKRAEGVIVFPIPHLAAAPPLSEEFYIRAREMRWVEPALGRKNYWLLQDGQIQTYDSDGRLVPPAGGGVPGEPPRPPFHKFFEHPLRTSLIPEELEASREEVVYMDLASLRRRAEKSADRRWTLMYFSRFATPLSALVLLMLGLPVITYYGSRNIFFGAMVSAVLATVYFVSSSTAGNLALRGFLPASLGAFLGPLAFASLGLTWLRSLRT